MTRPGEIGDLAAAGEPEAIQPAKTIGRRLGLEFQQLILHRDGRIEVEFEGEHPWECLVIKAVNWSELLAAAANEQPWLKLSQPAVIRKKCEKCLVHERQAEAM